MGLGDDELAALLEALKLEEFAPGETLIIEGTPTDVLYLVWRGSLDVSVSTEEGPLEIARVEPGEVLGEVSLLDPGPASATVRTEQGATALVLRRADLEVLWSRFPRVAEKFLRFLTYEMARRVRLALIQLNRTHAHGTTHADRVAAGATLFGGGH
jgi:CRP-like cAMP-binding protein